MKTYETYNNIDLPWLTAIPAHWNLVGLNLLFSDNDVKNEGITETNILSLSYGNIVKRKKEENYGLTPASYETYQVVNPGYIVLRLTDMQNDHKSLRVGLAKERGIITSAYTGLIPKQNVNSSYFYYLLHTLDLVKYIYVLGGGVRQSSDYNEIKKLKLPFPPLPEQTVIAKYLDEKCNSISTLLEKKKQLIEKYREKINVIVQTSTEKNTPVSKYWLNISDSWEVEKAKRIFTEFNSKNHPEEELLAATQDRGVILKSLCEQDFVSPSGDYNGLKLVTENDFVISLRSFQGGIEHSAYRGIISPAYTVIRLKPPYNNVYYNRYFKYLFKTPQMISLLNTAISGIREGKNINWVDFCDLPLPIPSVKDIEKMQNDFDRYEHLVRVFEKEKKLLEEYKATIIAEVVTGKIKVA